eukprot:142776_1
MASGWWYIDNSTLKALIQEVIFLILCTSILFKILKKHLLIYIGNCSFFKHVPSKLGVTRDLIVLAHHSIVVILLHIGISWKRSDIFRTAYLLEIAYDSYDLVNIYIQYFVFGCETSKAVFKIQTVHHLPTILVGIPLIYRFGDDPLVQNVGWSVMWYTPICLFTGIAKKCCDLSDLNGIIQSAVWTIISTLIMVYGRFIQWPIAMTQFIANRLIDEPWWAWTIWLFYGGRGQYYYILFAFNGQYLQSSIKRLHKLHIKYNIKKIM